MIRWKNALGAVALVGVTMFVTSHVVSQQNEKEWAAAYEAMAKPGPEHARLMKAVGNWTGENTCWMEPGTEPQVSSSTCEFKSMFGDRYLTQKVKGSFDMGGGPQDFEGFGIYGYDNLKKKHFFTWIDNMGTGVMLAEGTANAAGDEITYFSECPDPAKGGALTQFKSVSKVVNNDKHVFEMFTKMEDGSWHKMMQISSTRKK